MSIKKYRDLQADLGLSESTVRRMVERGEFPPPLRLSQRSIGWPEETIEQWLKERAAAAAAGTAT